MSGHLDGPPPGPPDPPYIPGDLGAPSAEEFARRRASSEPRPENPYRTVHARMSPPGAAWDEGFAAGRAAAHPDPPDMTNMCEGESPDHKPGITPAASPDERLREALREIVAAFPSPPDREMDDEEIEKWYADHGDWFQRLAALAAADREKPDEDQT